MDLDNLMWSLGSGLKIKNVLKKQVGSMIWMASREAKLTRLTDQVERARAQGKLAEAEDLCREKVELTGATFGKFDEDYAKALLDLAEILEAEQKYAEALSLRSRIINFTPAKDQMASGS